LYYLTSSFVAIPPLPLSNTSHTLITSPTSSLLFSPLLSAGFLGPDEEYVLVPTTFADGKLGSFVVSVTSATEFSFVVEKKQN
jgi:hypothetical protein